MSPREPSNYPPGVSGNEPQITGYPDHDPRITEAMLNVTLPEDRPTYWSDFPEMEEQARIYLDAMPHATVDELTEAIQEFLDRDPREET